MFNKSMCKYFTISLVIIFCCLIFTASISNAEEAQDKSAMPDHEKMMELYKEYSTPNENHKLLDAMIGEWDYTLKWWMSPDAEPEISKGTTELKWIMDGRFIKQKAEGISMGLPFEGMGIIGYDNEKKMYTSVWIDNMGTGIITGTGNYDPETRTLSEKGTFSCPAEGEKSYRAETKFLNEDSFTYEWYLTGPDGSEFKAMEITHSRKNKSL